MALPRRPQCPSECPPPDGTPRLFLLTHTQSPRQYKKSGTLNNPLTRPGHLHHPMSPVLCVAGSFSGPPPSVYRPKGASPLTWRWLCPAHGPHWLHPRCVLLVTALHSPHMHHTHGCSRRCFRSVIKRVDTCSLPSGAFVRVFTPPPPHHHHLHPFILPSWTPLFVYRSQLESTLGFSFPAPALP